MVAATVGMESVWTLTDILQMCVYMYTCVSGCVKYQNSVPVLCACVYIYVCVCVIKRQAAIVSPFMPGFIEVNFVLEVYYLLIDNRICV